jgi:hypothetical protein
MGFDRRSVLGGMAAAGLLSTAGAAAAAGPLRIRRPISSLPFGHPDLDAYRRAIPVLKQWGAWDDQIALHADMRHRHHSSWRFLAWHRLQLVWFERLVARASGKADFTMPYWDWDDDVIPDAFWRDELYDPTRRARQGDRVSDFMRQYGYSLRGRLTDDFPTFIGRTRTSSNPQGSLSGSAEWSGHNLIHTFVGGDMGDLGTSPNDPLFWLHHANIDRIWSIWHSRRSAQVYPKAWRDEQLGGFFGPTGLIMPTVTAGTTIDTAAFGYAYPYDPTPPVFFAVAPPPPRAAGEAAPPPPRIRRRDYRWAMQRMGPSSAFIEISADLARGQATSATGQLTITPDHHAGTVTTLVARTKGAGREVFRESVFSVPMGHAMGPRGFSIPLEGLWGAADSGGVRLEIETTAMGESMPGMGPALVDFVLDAKLAFQG